MGKTVVKQKTIPNLSVQIKKRINEVYGKQYPNQHFVDAFSKADSSSRYRFILDALQEVEAQPEEKKKEIEKVARALAGDYAQAAGSKLDKGSFGAAKSYYTDAAEIIEKYTNDKELAKEYRKLADVAIAQVHASAFVMSQRVGFY
ncbi:MAG: hypothetical protein ABIH83_05930 [Candidatus Micrarchaeota archaeon]